MTQTDMTPGGFYMNLEAMKMVTRAMNLYPESIISILKSIEDDHHE